MYGRKPNDGDLVHVDRYHRDVVSFAIGPADAVDGNAHSWTCGCRADADGEFLAIAPCGEHIGEFDEAP